MKIYQTQDIRNIALVGGVKSGKTSMAEAMAWDNSEVVLFGHVKKRMYLCQ